ncbi:serine/threonine-protein kinase [Actinophytocola sp.]|uniref:serine/threonine-protein kinase n=1 Tax=Actinophytocola sp. TaxID=1872138 RepID=UPI002ED52915
MVWQFGHYRMEGLIARGGMGEVHRAYDTQHDRVVAIKILGAHTAADHDYRQRFVREAKAAARLREPHVIPIHAYGEIDGRLYLDMRLVEGDDLSATLATHGPMSPAAAVDVVGQIASALDAAHAEGLVHRDIKPSNVLLAAGGFAYLVDFGIARSMAAHADITGTGVPIGTVAYMAPERFTPDGRVDHRVDVYSLACVLFQCLTGAQPFSGGNMLALMHAHLHKVPPAATALRPDLAPAFDDIIATGMAKRPEDRFESAGALAAAARQALSQPAPSSPATLPAPRPRSTPVTRPTPSRRGLWWLAGTAAVVAVAGLVVAAMLNWPLGSPDDKAANPPTTPTTTATTVTTPTGPPTTQTSAADLSVSVPISTPACDGGYIVIVGSAIDPNNYQRTVQAFLDANPGARYLHTPSTGCSSLQQQVDGVDVYAVYYGPFVRKNRACEMRNDIGGDTFIRRLDNTSTPAKGVSCG